MATIKELWDKHLDKRPLRVWNPEREFDYFEVIFISKDGYAHGMYEHGDGDYWSVDRCGWSLYVEPPKMVKLTPALVGTEFWGPTCRRESVTLSTIYFKDEEEAQNWLGPAFIRLEERLAIELPEKEREK